MAKNQSQSSSNNDGRGFYSDSEEDRKKHQKAGDARVKAADEGRAPSMEDTGRAGGEATQNSENRYELTDKDRRKGGEASAEAAEQGQGPSMAQRGQMGAAARWDKDTD